MRSQAEPRGLRPRGADAANRSPGEDGCPSSVNGAESKQLPPLFVWAGAQWIRGNLPSEPTISNADLIQKHPHRHIQK